MFGHSVSLIMWKLRKLVNFPLLGLPLGWHGDFLGVWLQVLEDCSELVLIHLNHEICGSLAFGA